MKKSSVKTTGLVLGKFLPPHKGHQFLIDFAQNYVDELYVVLGVRPTDSIDGILRTSWMKEMFPNVKIIVVEDKNPEETDPNYWDIWTNTLKQSLPFIPTYFFASEDYGWTLSKLLGMNYIPVNHPRTLVPVSATKIRNNPLKYWEYIPEIVRPYFLKKVCIYGPESTGKSTLTINLAKHFHTCYVDEYARGLLDFKQGNVEYSDIPDIVRGHTASQLALAKQANRILFSDTDVITTIIWSDVLFHKCPPWIYKKAEETTYDLYLLLDVDVPWVEDPQRYLPHQRKEFFERCEAELVKRGRPYRVIRGSWEERLKQSIEAVNTLL